MPYLMHDWMIGDELVPQGTWVPEHNWECWTRRGQGVESQDMPWRHRTPDAVSPVLPTDTDDVTSASQIDKTAVSSASQTKTAAVSDRMIPILAGDLVSAQRDAHVYRTLIERLRISPSDATADAIVHHMQTLGMASAHWPEKAGGPPSRPSPRLWRQRPRLWRPVLDWLLRLAAQTARLLINLVDKAGKVLSSLGVSAVGVELSFPEPKVSVEFPTDTVVSGTVLGRARTFLDGALAELEEKVFS